MILVWLESSACVGTVKRNESTFICYSDVRTFHFLHFLLPFCFVLLFIYRSSFSSFNASLLLYNEAVIVQRMRWCEPCRLDWSTAIRANLLRYPSICPWISNTLRELGLFCGWTVSLPSTGQPVCWDQKFFLGCVFFYFWNLALLVSGRSAVGFARGPPYIWASEVLIYFVICYVVIELIAWGCYFYLLLMLRYYFMEFHVIYLFQ